MNKDFLYTVEIFIARMKNMGGYDNLSDADKKDFDVLEMHFDEVNKNG